MRKILAVIKREYLQIVKTKGFIIGTILGPVLMSLFLKKKRWINSESKLKSNTSKNIRLPTTCL